MIKPIEVLLVEDEAGEILLMNQVLAREPVPISLHVAVDGEQAVQILTQGLFKPDVIVLDLNLPKLSGLAFLERYRPTAPVIVLTSSASPVDEQRAFELGAKEYIQKTSDLSEFIQLVSKIIRHWAHRDSPVKAT